MDKTTTQTKEDMEVVEDKAFAEAKKIDKAKLHTKMDEEFDPRILAYDLQIFTSGPRRLENLRYAFDLTHEHMEDMGAKIAPTKSVTFASNVTSRKWLRNHRWRRLGKEAPRT